MRGTIISTLLAIILISTSCIEAKIDSAYLHAQPAIEEVVVCEVLSSGSRVNYDVTVRLNQPYNEDFTMELRYDDVSERFTYTQGYDAVRKNLDVYYHNFDIDSENNIARCPATISILDKDDTPISSAAFVFEHSLELEEIPWNTSAWSVVGPFNDRGGDVEMATTNIKNLFVAKNLKLDAYDTFVVRGDGMWNEYYGGGIVYMNPNGFIKVYHNGSNIIITEAGIFDIYFDCANKFVYVVDAGTDYTTVPMQTTEGYAKTQSIEFKDNNVKRICTSYWDKDGDGELSYEEAAAVTDLGTVFRGSAIIEFTELNYFTSLENIANSAFYSCDSLASVTIPDSVTTIGDYAFYGCDSLADVTIPNSVTTIGYYVFYGCASLTDVTILGGVTTIGEAAFYECTSLTSVTIPDSVTSIGKGAFSHCPSLADVTIPGGVTTIGDYAFYDCDSLESITIPNSVTTIGYGAFYDCDSLKSVTIGNGVTMIGDYAFRECVSLTEVYCKPATPPVGGVEMFYFNADICYIYVSTASVEAYKTAEYWSDYTDNIVGYDF